MLRISLRSWDEWERHEYIPKAVPSECGTLLNRKSTTNPHKLKASIGAGGRSMIVRGPTRFDASETANLASAMLPKYTASILFLDVTAYTLRQNQPVKRCEDMRRT